MDLLLPPFYDDRVKGKETETILTDGRTEEEDLGGRQRTTEDGRAAASAASPTPPYFFFSGRVEKKGRSGFFFFSDGLLTRSLLAGGRVGRRRRRSHSNGGKKRENPFTGNEMRYFAEILPQSVTKITNLGLLGSHFWLKSLRRIRHPETRSSPLSLVSPVSWSGWSWHQSGWQPAGYLPPRSPARSQGLLAMINLWLKQQNKLYFTLILEFKA